MTSVGAFVLSLLNSRSECRDNGFHTYMIGCKNVYCLFVRFYGCLRVDLLSKCKNSLRKQLKLDMMAHYSSSNILEADVGGSYVHVYLGLQRPTSVT